MEKPASKKLRWYTIRWRFLLWTTVVLISGWYVACARYQHPIGRGPAGPAIAPLAYERSWLTNPVVLLGIGDSMTAGFGASTGHSYFDMLGRNDDTRHPDMRGRDLWHVFPNFRRMNRSVSYTTSAEHLRDQLPKIYKFPPNTTGIVVITTGGNDLIHSYGLAKPRDGAMYGCTVEQTKVWKESFRERLLKILAETKSKFPGGCEIFLANIYDPTDGVGDIEKANIVLPAWPDGMFALTSFNTVIAEVCAADPHVHLVDIHSLFLGHGIHCEDVNHPSYRKEDPGYWYFRNLEDPNDRGYDALRRAFLIEMSKVFASAK